MPTAEVIAAHPSERIHGPEVVAAQISGWLSSTFDLSTCLDPTLVAEAVAAARSYVRRPHSHDRGAHPVLGRSDGCAANMLWDDERCLWLDFEDSGTSDPAFEVDHFRRVFACFWLYVLLPGSRGYTRNPLGTLERQASHCNALLGR